MEFGTLRPLLASLALPPVAPLLLALLGLLLAFRGRRGGLSLALVSLILLGLLSCHGASVWLARSILPQFAPLPVAALKTGKVQAVVVLGGGALPQAPEYGEAQPNAQTAARLRYGVWLARQYGLPLGFSGGMGWAASDTQQDSEADVARRAALQDYRVTLRWNEAEARDTAGNARLMASLLRRDGVQRIALVTHAWHMPRSVAAFEAVGFQVTPAPMGYVVPLERDILEWMPSAQGLMASRQVLREWLALALARL
jgi:uncharacterized SAM-binding protein YcdF (DUF218 family)